MNNESFTEKTPLLWSVLLVLLLPQELHHGMLDVLDVWPAVGEVSEPMLFLFVILITTLITFVFSRYIEIETVTFAFLAVIGPFISIYAPIIGAIILTGTGGLHPAQVALSAVYVVGFLLGLAAAGYVSRM